ncbi:hypothetical protein [Megasphaera sp. SW808]|uniref:hypothetical protein n=1 Tax=Megasphaera sp. SW808 TaxID=2530045 RepID=UPI0019809BB3|nr:hypothetical protein [Megasphaera sp. SW808]
MTIQAGQYVTDGTAVFIIDDVRDGFRVGDIVFRPVLHDGFIKANGAQVKASDYPRLVKYAQDNGLIVDDNSTDKTKYMYDAGADTLTLPDAQGRVLQGTTDSIKEIGAGLPNITGIMSTHTSVGIFGDVPEYNGCFELGDSMPRAPESIAIQGYKLNFDASLSNAIYGASETVQPPALALIPQIKY